MSERGGRLRRWLQRVLAPTCADCGESIVGRRTAVQARMFHSECLPAAVPVGGRFR